MWKNIANYRLTTQDVQWHVGELGMIRMHVKGHGMMLRLLVQSRASNKLIKIESIMKKIERIG